MNERSLLIIASVAGVLAILAGTFAAHVLDGRLSPEQLVTFDTGARYHMYHALALLACAAFAGRIGPATTLAAVGFMLGILLFSGSLYTLAMGGPRWLGAVAALGGTTFLLGWTALGVGAFMAGQR